MGRMLETFKQAGSRRGRPVESAREETPPVPESVAPSEPVEEEVPYIEVGGPGTSIEASASVLASGPLPVRGKFSPSPSTPVTPPPADPTRVTFRPMVEEPSAALERVAPQIISFHHPDHPVSLQYRDLWMALRATLPGPPPQVVLFTQTAPGIGGTTALLNLAVTAARQGHGPVLVIDGDPLVPAVAQRLAVAATPGLGEVLAGRAAVRQAVRETGQANLFVLPAGALDLNANLSGPGGRLSDLIRLLRGSFNLILLDGAAWDGTPEAAALACAGDAVYLVLAPEEVNEPATQQLALNIQQQGGLLRGTVITPRRT